jgi:Outer membrane protein beta-barrel domain
MKKTIPFLFILMFLSPLAEAQFYYARLGFGISGSISNNRDLLYSYSNDGSTRSVTAVPLGLGRGITGIAAFGYKPSKYIGIEIGLSEFVGLPRIADSVANVPGGTNVEARVKGNMLCLTPAVVISPGFEKVDPYARIGLVIGLRPTINATVTYTRGGVNPPEEYKIVRQYYGNIALGLNAAMGVAWNITDLISLYAEFDFTSINYSPNYSDVILYQKNGVDQLSTLTVKQTKTEYHNSINPDEKIADTSPDQALKKTLPFSNAGMTFGITFHF